MKYTAYSVVDVVEFPVCCVVCGGCGCLNSITAVCYSRIVLYLI